MAAALEHVTVVELCDGIAGAYCARQFAAWGAQVVAVEPPGGSPLRQEMPQVQGPDGAPISLLWQYVGANKRSIAIDRTDGAGRRRLHGLVAQADVLVTDWSRERLEAAGIDVGSLASATPGLVAVSISPFGEDGPYVGFASSDLVIQALSGILSLSGYPGCAPLKLPANILPYACGVSAFVAAMAALHERRLSGAGQQVDVACLEAVASLVLFLRAQYLGEPFPRRSGVGTVLLPCSDGYVLCSPAMDAVWEALQTALAINLETIPKSLRTMAERYLDLGAVRTFLAQYSRQIPARQLFHRLGMMQVVAGLLESPADLLRDEHLEARGYFRSLCHPVLGVLRLPGPAGRMSETPLRPPVLAPEAACESAAIVAEQPPAGRGSRRIARPSNRPPLNGVRVLDLTGAWIGPYAAMLLADLGADVIKIESPSRPDVWRIFRPASSGRPELPSGANPRAHPRNTSFYYNSVNRNKRGLTLNLASPDGKQLFRMLVASADIVMENFTPRVMENFGLGHEEVHRLRPDLITVSFSGYGATGPYRDYKANGATIETIAGWTSLFGYPDEGPMSMGEMEADPLSGLQMAAQALVALEYRERTGRGQHIDGSMFEAAAGYIGEQLLHAAAAGEITPLRGNRDQGMAPQGVFPCDGDDQWIAITVRHDADWLALRAIANDAPALEDIRFATFAGRLSAIDELEAALAEWTRTQPAARLMRALQLAGVPAGVVLKTDQVPQDTHFVQRGWFGRMTHADTGTHLYTGYPWRFSRSELVWRMPSPRVGEHSAAVLHEVLGIGAARYDELWRSGVTGAVLEWPDSDEPGA